MSTQRTSAARVVDDQPKPPARPGLLDADADEPRRAVRLIGPERWGVTEVELGLVPVVTAQAVAHIAPNPRRYGLVHAEREVLQCIGGGLANSHRLRLPQPAAPLSTAPDRSKTYQRECTPERRDPGTRRSVSSCRILSRMHHRPSSQYRFALVTGRSIDTHCLTH